MQLQIYNFNLLKFFKSVCSEVEEAIADPTKSKIFLDEEIVNLPENVRPLVTHLLQFLMTCSARPSQAIEILFAEGKTGNTLRALNARMIAFPTINFVAEGPLYEKATTYDLNLKKAMVSIAEKVELCSKLVTEGKGFNLDSTMEIVECMPKDLRKIVSFLWVSLSKTLTGDIPLDEQVKHLFHKDMEKHYTKAMQEFSEMFKIVDFKVEGPLYVEFSC